jgi:hypothetical protein
MLRYIVGSYLLMLVLAFPAFAGDLYGTIGFIVSREFGGFSEHPEGSLVTVDLESLGQADTLSGYSRNPGGTTFVSDLFDGPADPDAAWVTGLAFDSRDRLWVATFECSDPSLCFDGPSRLLQVDPNTGGPTEIGFITHNNVNQNILDLSVQPGTDTLFGISYYLDLENACFGCLFTIDTATANATLVGTVDLGNGEPGGLAFTSDGTLYLTTQFPVSGAPRGAKDLLVLDPANGDVLSREAVLLEQQFYFRSILIDSVSLTGLAVNPDGTLIASSGEMGITILYERVWGKVKDPDGNEVPGEKWVWRLLGDSGEGVTDLDFRPATTQFVSADLDNDGDVDGRDLLIFNLDFGRRDCSAGPACEGDIYPVDAPDGAVDESDLAIWVTYFGCTGCSDLP